MSYKEVPLDEIVVNKSIVHDHYHESGRQIFYRKEFIDDFKINFLRNAGVKTLFRIKNKRELNEFSETTHKKEIKLSPRMVGKRIATSLFDSTGRTIIERGIKITETHLHNAMQGKYRLFKEKSKQELKENEVDEYFSFLQKLNEEKEGELVEVENISQKVFSFSSESKTFDRQGRKSSAVLDDLLKADNAFHINIHGNRLLENNLNPFINRSSQYKEDYQIKFNELIDGIKELFAAFKKPGSVQLNTIVNFASKIVNTIISDKDLVTNLTNQRNIEFEDYLVWHTLNVALYSINIGCTMKFSEALIFELALGALLSDIGMLFVPKEIVFKESPLTSLERKMIKNHPAMGLDLIEGLKGLPVNIPYIIYQSHEKPDSTGYPKGRPSHLIHDFAKIIAIADTFDSLCSHRPWRKGMIPYKAMERMLSLAKKKKIDFKILKKWLSCMSLFPVGSWIVLNDESVSRVISANPEDILRPCLRVLYQGKDKLDEPRDLNLLDRGDLTVTHALHPNEVNGNVLEGF